MTDQTETRQPLTPLQAAVVRFVAEYVQEHGYGPSRDEITAATGAGCPITQRLITRGVLHNLPGVHRTLRVNPLYGPN